MREETGMEADELVTGTVAAVEVGGKYSPKVTFEIGFDPAPRPRAFGGEAPAAALVAKSRKD